MSSVNKRNLIFVPILFIVCVVFFILVCVFFHAAAESMESANNIKAFADLDVYCTKDATDDDKLAELFGNSEDAVVRCKSFFAALDASDTKYYTEYGYEMPISNNGAAVSELNVSDGFFDALGVTAYEGRLFTKEEYESLSDELPVVIGYELRDKYEIGQVYPFDVSSMETKFAGRIVGVLKKNSSYCRLSAPMLSISMDNSYILPLGAARFSVSQEVADFDMALSHMVYFLHDDSEIEHLNSLIDQMDTFTLHINSVKDDYDATVNDSLKMYIVMGSILVVLLSVILILACISFRRI